MITQVTGSVIIIGNHFSNLSLTSLRVIRGVGLYHPFAPKNTKSSEKIQGYADINNDRGYSLFVALNHKKGSTTVGLKELQLVSLHGCNSSPIVMFFTQFQDHLFIMFNY